MGRSVKRSAPMLGYRFPSKMYYRKTIWNKFRDHCSPRVADSRALLMPSIEGDEIDQAIAKGFREENLTIVDRNPAIVATLKRRYRRLSTSGRDVADAGLVLSASGHYVRVANLDLCGCISDGHLETVRAFVASGVVPRGLIAVTSLRGREKNIAAIDDASNTKFIGAKQPWRGWDPPSSFSDSDTRDKGRIVSICMAATGENKHILNQSEALRRPYRSFLAGWGTYKSIAGNQTMLWTLLTIHRNPCICDLCISSTAVAFGVSGKDALDLTLGVYGCSRDEAFNEMISAVAKSNSMSFRDAYVSVSSKSMASLTTHGNEIDRFRNNVVQNDCAV